MKEPTDWHLNKSVSISVILLLVANISSSIWWASKITSEVEVLKGRPDVTERVIHLEAITSEQGRILNRLDSTIDKVDATLDDVMRELARRSPYIERLDNRP